MDAMDWRATMTTFEPHAVLCRERTAPELGQIWVVVVLGAQRLLRVNLDTSLPVDTYTRQIMDRIVRLDCLPHFARSFIPFPPNSLTDRSFRLAIVQGPTCRCVN